MKCRFPIFAIWIASIVVVTSTACTEPADAVAIGEICYPERAQCPNSQALQRPGVGRNSLEFTLYAETDDDEMTTSVIRVTTPDDISLPESREQSDEGHTILFEADYPLAGGETLRESLDSYDLTVATRLSIELLCSQGDCESRLQFLYFSDAIECVDDAQCSRNEFCEASYGRCAECTSDEHCDGTQSCDRPTGQCFPSTSTGCHATSNHWPSTPPFLLLLVLIGAGIRRWFRNLPVGHGHRMTVATIGLAGCLLLPIPSANAGGSASMNAGGGMRALTGDAGDLTHPGWGITVNHQLRWGNFATLFQLSTNSFRLSDAAGADRERITGYGISLGPRAYYSLPLSVPTLTEDVHPFEVFAGLSYTRWSIAENRLASVTGLDLNYHAVGPSIGVLWKRRSLQLTGRIQYSQIFDWPGGVFSLDFTVGIAP